MFTDSNARLPYCTSNMRSEFPPLTPHTYSAAGETKCRSAGTIPYTATLRYASHNRVLPAFGSYLLKTTQAKIKIVMN